MNIRDVRPEDRDDYIGMTMDFYHNTDACDHTIPEEHVQRTFDQALEGSPYLRALMLEEEGRPVGYFLLAMTWSNEAGGMVVWLEELYFRASCRGKGYGRQAMQWVEQEYPKARRYRLEATLVNEDAMRLYRRLGYQNLDYLQMIKE